MGGAKLILKSRLLKGRQKSFFFGRREFFSFAINKFSSHFSIDLERRYKTAQRNIFTEGQKVTFFWIFLRNKMTQVEANRLWKHCKSIVRA